MMKTLLITLTLSLTCAFGVFSQTGPAKSAKEELLQKFQGNWYLPSSNSWEYGFFEDFVIHQGERWSYGQVNAVKDTYHVQLGNDNGDRWMLQLHGRKDGVLEVKNQATRRTDRYKKVGLFLPAYPGVDTTAFYDSKFARVDTACIRGYLRHNTSRDPYRISVSDLISGEQKHYFGDIDSLGFFAVKIPLLNTSQIFMDWSRSNLLGVLEPNESFFIYHDLKSKETIVYGQHARLHNELLRYDLYTDSNHIRPKTQQGWQAMYAYEDSIDHDAFLDLKLAQLDSMRAIDSNFVKRHGNLSDRARYYIGKHTDYQIAFQLGQRKFKLDRATKEQFSPRYEDVLKIRFYDQLSVPVTLIRENITFLRDYLAYQAGGASRFVSHMAVLDELIKNVGIQVTPPLAQYVDLMAGVGMGGFSVTDSLKMVRMIEADTTINTQLLSIQQEHVGLIEQYMQKKLYLDYYEALYDQYLEPELSEVLYTHEVLSLTTRSPLAFHPVIFEDILSKVSKPFLRELITDKNDELLQVSARDHRYDENLRRTDHLKGAQGADAILASILAPHLGKVVYIDFWGTWCAPCVAEMEYVPNLKKETEGMEVVYLYFANNTPEHAWKNFIKLKNLEGEQVFHYNLDQEQQSAIERRLGVSSFPTYMLVNKKGEFVNMKAPRPSQKDQLIQAMKKLLEE